MAPPDRPPRPFEIAGFDVTDFAGLAPGVAPPTEAYRVVPMAQLRPDPANARKRFDAEALAELAASIGAVGIVEPLIVVQTDPDVYQIRSGERRFRAAKLAGLSEVPVIVRPALDPVSAIVVNLQRRDLGVFELADALGTLVDAGVVGQADLARRLGKSRSYVSELLSLRRLPPALRRRAEAGGVVDLRALADLARVQSRLTPQGRALLAEAPALTRAVVAQAQSLMTCESTQVASTPCLAPGAYLRLTVRGRTVLIGLRVQPPPGPVPLLDPDSGALLEASDLPVELELVRIPANPAAF